MCKKLKDWHTDQSFGWGCLVITEPMWSFLRLSKAELCSEQISHAVALVVIYLWWDMLSACPHWEDRTRSTGWGLEPFSVCLVRFLYTCVSALRLSSSTSSSLSFQRLLICFVQSAASITVRSPEFLTGLLSMCNSLFLEGKPVVSVDHGVQYLQFLIRSG